jgi:hypothetical protein
MPYWGVPLRVGLSAAIFFRTSKRIFAAIPHAILLCPREFVYMCLHTFFTVNKQYYLREICGYNFDLRRIDTTFNANIAENNQNVYLQQQKLANL